MSYEDFKRAVQDGKISTTVMAHDELYTKFKNALSSSSSEADAVFKVHLSTGVSERTVYRAIEEFR
jgi:hypothetical protein